MFARLNIRPIDLGALERIEAAVRAHFALDAARIVLVNEEAGRLPGGPDRITTILFWTAPERRHKVRIFKPADQVVAADLPAAWLVNALMDDGEEDCC